MNKKLQYIVIAAALGLVGLVVLQINWINHAAQLREDHFDHTVNMAVCSAVDKISKDKMACQALGVARNAPSNEFRARIENVKENTCVDSLLEHELRYYKIDLDYEYTLTWFSKKKEKSIFQLAGFSGEPYKLSLCRIPQASGLELLVTFPGKGRYIYAQMGMMLFSSVALIILLSGCFVASFLMILKQKKIHSMTTEFITNMTHEFKTPLATIALASSMLRKGKVADNAQKAQKYANVIHEEQRKLREHVEQVLSMAKLERGEFKLQKTFVCMHSIIEKAIASVEMQVQNKDGEILYTKCGQEAQASVDALHLTNAIANLLDNANKYTPETPRIVVSSKVEDNCLLISVEDNGIGMSKDKQKMVFDKFYRVPTGNVHDVKGFGLGLAYVKMIVERHNGFVHVKSELGKGSVFTISIPLEEMPMPEAQAA